MKKGIFTLIILLFIILFSYIYITKINLFNEITSKEHDPSGVHIKAFINSNCVECTKVKYYLEVYKQAGVKFENIHVKEYGTDEYKAHFNEYDIKKLPFIVFGKELVKYETIANSWNDTFGYKNDDGEFIATDIIPPYFDLETNKIKGLIDIKYIGDIGCNECYRVEDSIGILGNFGLKFKDIQIMKKESKEAVEFIQKYDIDTFPAIVLSKNTKLYKNFAYFWKTIGTIEKDGSYILRKPGKIGLKMKN